MAPAPSGSPGPRGFVFPSYPNRLTLVVAFLVQRGKKRLQGGGAGRVGKHARWLRAAPHAARALGSTGAGTPGLVPLRFGFAFKMGPGALPPGPTAGPCTALLSGFSLPPALRFRHQPRSWDSRGASPFFLPHAAGAAFPLSSSVSTTDPGFPHLGFLPAVLPLPCPMKGPADGAQAPLNQRAQCPCHLPLPHRPHVLSASSSLDQMRCPLLAPPPFPPEKALWWVSPPWPPNVPAAAR